MKNHSSSHFPSTPRARRNFIEAWKEEGRWKVKRKCEENESGMGEEIEKMRDQS